MAAGSAHARAGGAAAARVWQRAGHRLRRGARQPRSRPRPSRRSRSGPRSTTRGSRRAGPRKAPSRTRGSGPSAGFYDSGDPAVLRAHVASMAYGGFDAAVVSWWGPGAEGGAGPACRRCWPSAHAVDPAFRIGSTDEREGSGIRRCRRSGPISSTSRRTTPAGRSSCGWPAGPWCSSTTPTTPTARWSTAGRPRRHDRVLPGDEGVPGVRAVRPAARRVASVQPGVALCGRRASRPDVAGSVTISPGFAHAGPPADRPQLARDVRRWTRSVRDMVASRAPWQLVTTFNEWGEGTAIESATAWPSPSGQGVYLDALHAATR